MTTEQTRDVFTVNELNTIIANFTKADRVRLEKAANSLCWGLPFNGEDLLSEIFCRALEGRRKCPRNVPIPVFLIRAMESCVDAYLRKRIRDPLEQTAPPIIGEDDDSEDWLDRVAGGDTPEEILQAKQTMERCEEILFANDERSQMIFMGQIDGLSPAEIQDICGISPVEYASALRGIRRKLDKFAKEESLA